MSDYGDTSAGDVTLSISKGKETYLEAALRL